MAMVTASTSSSSPRTEVRTRAQASKMRGVNDQRFIDTQRSAPFASGSSAAGFSRAGVGDLTLLVAGACFSLYTVLSRPLADRYGPLIVLSYTLLFSMPVMLPLTLPFLGDVHFSALGPWVWAGLFWALVVCSFVGWLSWTWVNSKRGIARSAPFMAEQRPASTSCRLP